jgi:hypothetical protein
VRPKRRGMRLVLSGRSLAALAAKLGMLVASLTVLSSIRAEAADESPQADRKVRTIYHKGRNFRIPFNFKPADRARIKELHLLVSEDQGYHWRAISTTYPDNPTFTFRSSHDGEYWFAVQTLRTDGRVSPDLDSTVEPNMIVVVDTFRPTLDLDADKRRGSLISVRWEAKDENLDLKSLVIEYQVEGVGVWRRVPVKKPKSIGGQQWDAGTAEALKVRATVADKAGNLTEAVVDVPEGTASAGDLVTRDPSEDGPPAMSPMPGDMEPEISAAPSFTPVNPRVAAGKKPSTASAQSARTVRGAASGGSTRSRTPDWGGESGTPAVARAVPPVAEPPARDLFLPDPSAQRPGSADPAAFTQAPPRDGGAGTLLVADPRFKLQYAIDDAGPDGPATVELWITQDGGRTWIRRGDDPNRVSPIEVDLGGEGTYGICLVARSASGLGDQPPAPGDAPQSWVEVDSTPPAVQLQPPQVGTGANSGKVAIGWRASDLHLAPRSVKLSWRRDQPGDPWQTIAEAQENVGQYVWTLPPTAPQRFHLKVEAVDSVGHLGSAETTDMGPITVDRSRPRSRIIGLDQNERAGAGPSARPMR